MDSSPKSSGFTVVTRLGGKVSFFPNGQMNSSFFPSGVTPDPNPGNNTRIVQTPCCLKWCFVMALNPWLRADQASEGHWSHDRPDAHNHVRRN